MTCLLYTSPREGFQENILTNLSMLRRKIQSPNLKFEFSSLGNITKTKTCLAYVDGLVDKKVLKEIKRRLKKIDIDSVDVYKRQVRSLLHFK